MLSRAMPRITTLMLVLLVIEFLDEFVFGIQEAGWPLIRDDLDLSYAQIGILLSLPRLLGSVVEPPIGILGDVWKRKWLILGGGVAFVAALALISASQSFLYLLAAFILFNPASGAFVGLSQATLMDSEPTRHQQNMARWTLAGSLGVVLGAAALGVAVLLGVGWRVLFLSSAIAAVLVLVAARGMPLGGASGTGQSGAIAKDLKQGIIDALRALKRFPVLRWLVLLEFSDLMLDGLHGYLALYFVDVVGTEEASAAMGVAVWTGVGLLGDLMLIPLLERVRGLTYLRFSAAAELLLYPAFLLVPGLWPKLAIVGMLGFANAGWYSVLKGQLYSSMPGQSGTVMAVNDVSNLFGSFIPLGIGIAARTWGLGAA
ncbi:MAG: MFS transporter, partial [SAR202 cluster bacterium]|nr:MFS transporter [SAR202 cluster bacterium]